MVGISNWRRISLLQNAHFEYTRWGTERLRTWKRPGYLDCEAAFHHCHEQEYNCREIDGNRTSWRRGFDSYSKQIPMFWAKITRKEQVPDLNLKSEASRYDGLYSESICLILIYLFVGSQFGDFAKLSPRRFATFDDSLPRPRIETSSLISWIGYTSIM